MYMATNASDLKARWEQHEKRAPLSVGKLELRGDCICLFVALIEKSKNGNSEGLKENILG